MEQERPKVGIGVMIFKAGKVLVGLRKYSHGAGEYAFPGGHLEHLESLEDCARRETEEECGIQLKNIKFQFIANVKKYAPKHYVHIGFTAEWASGDPEVREPGKMEDWQWYAIDELPEPMFEMARLAFESHRTGQIFYDV